MGGAQPVDPQKGWNLKKIPHHQSHRTWYNRYPDVFGRCVDYFGGNTIRILSFGCSTGDEVKTLREMYFQDSKIHGVDIDDEMTRACLALENEKTSFSSEPDGMYDLIFCMSILCRGGDVWSDGYFADFDEQLVALDAHLNIGGLLVIYNSRFRLADSTVYSRYEPVCEFEESGFIKKYDPVGNLVGVYKHVIFKKNAAC